MPATSKRKKIADMPDSPPKRVTRSRAKASDDVGSQARTVKIMTPSAKAAIGRKKPVERAKAPTRRTRAHDEDDEPTIKDLKAEVPKKTRGRPVKVNAMADEVKLPAPKSRARPTKNPNAHVEQDPNTAETEKVEPPKVATRTRAAAARTRTATTNDPLKPLVPKKKVQFEEDAKKDKENLPVELERTAPKATGLRAKPIRKPAATKTGTRGRRAAPGKTEAKTRLVEDHVQPLSPKKVKQVAKSSSIGSEDELCSEKTPVRALSKSPVKPPPSSVRNSENAVTKLDFGAATPPSSPTKTTTLAVLQSPARRPPLSPFKDALRQSPKKGLLGESSSQPILVARQSPFKSTMKDSPKRGLAPLSLKPMMLLQTPLKASLLQSPARRPGASPSRDTVTKSSSKASGLEARECAETPLSSPQEACSSPLRISRTPAQPFKVHNFSKTDGNLASQSTTPGTVSHEVATFGANRDSGLGKIQEATYKEAEDVSSEEVQMSDICGFEQGNEDVFAAPNEEAEHQLGNQNTMTQCVPAFQASAFSLASPAFRNSVEESDSEDELASPQKVFLDTPVLRQGTSVKDFGCQSTDSPIGTTNRATRRLKANRPSIAMTPLAVQMSAWLASSPEKKTPAITSQSGQMVFPSTEVVALDSPPKVSFFEDEMIVLGSKDDELPDTEMRDCEQDLLLVPTSQESQASEEYGDENEMPAIEHQVMVLEDTSQDQTMTCTPAKTFYAHPREIHTVSKVPLRPAADDAPSPLKVPRKRSRSLTESSTSTTGIQRQRKSTLPLGESAKGSSSGSSRGSCSTPPKHRSGNDDSLIIETPKTLRKSTVSSVLKGAVVYVDVHTTEGEDASGIFLELLAQMGARCVKQWSWNPRASMAGGAQSPTGSVEDSGEAEASNNKVGITHVVYKDGGKRTLEKVRASKGGVHCVGVGWVLDCEREDKWLDEADYAIDTTIIPRGGHRRRKSMEPRMLANLNGNLVPAQTPANKPPVEMSPTKEFLNFDTPASRRESFAVGPTAPSTPTIQTDGGHVFGDSPLSPTTPYYLSKGAQLVQQTCPPKQRQELLFPISGRIDDQPDEAVRQRLLMARRKSLQWVPKVSSPLGRAVSYGK